MTFTTKLTPAQYGAIAAAISKRLPGSAFVGFRQHAMQSMATWNLHVQDERPLWEAIDPTQRWPKLTEAEAKAIATLRAEIARALLPAGVETGPAAVVDLAKPEVSVPGVGDYWRCTVFDVQVRIDVEKREVWTLMLKRPDMLVVRDVFTVGSARCRLMLAALGLKEPVASHRDLLGKSGLVRIEQRRQTTGELTNMIPRDGWLAPKTKD